MADIKVIASPDFEEHKASLVTLLGSAVLGIRRKGEWGSEQIDLKQHLESIAVQTEDDIRKLSGAAGWGLAGTLALGPLGLVLGALWGARKHKEICFAAHLKDGRKFLGVTDAKTFQKLQAITFK
jgi:hypothetical protein